MILFRCFPWDREAGPQGPGGALWFPRRLQGRARHYNPDLYGCLYTAEVETATVAEQLQRFRGHGRLRPRWLGAAGLPLALASVELPDDFELIDLDQPRVLDAEQLRPSQVATHDRTRTQEDAASLFRRHEQAEGIRWWSTLEASWLNVTIFDRGARSLRLEGVRELTVFDPAVREAAELLGLG